MPNPQTPNDQVSIPFFNNGAAFKPQVFIADVAGYEQEIRRAVYNKDPEGPTFNAALLAARKNFVETILARETPLGTVKQYELGVRAVNDAFALIWAYCFREEPRPLG